MEQDKVTMVEVESGGRMFYVVPGARGAIFEKDPDDIFVPAKGLTPEHEQRLRQIAETRPARPG